MSEIILLSSKIWQLVGGSFKLSSLSVVLNTLQEIVLLSSIRYRQLSCCPQYALGNCRVVLNTL